MDIVETRRENLRRWIARFGTPPKERSLFSQLKAHGSFGERVARRLEEQYRMGAGYLDQDLGAPQSSNGPEGSLEAEAEEERTGPTLQLAQEEQVFQLQWISDKEAELLNEFRGLEPLGQEAVLEVARSLPRAVEPARRTNKA